MKLDAGHLQVVRSILTQNIPHIEVRAFGSRVTGINLKPFSDLDLVLMTQQPLPSAVIGRLDESFRTSNLPFKVDIVDWSAISADFQAVISRKFERLLP